MTDYLKGKGVDLSQTRILQEKNTIHAPIKRNGLFSLREIAEPETLDFTFIEDIAETKFYPIILKEMLIYTKVNGFIIIKLKENKQLFFNKLVKEATNLFQEKAALRKEDKKNKILVFQKTNPLLKKEDSINNWTFGIITNGKKTDWIEEQINAIRKLNIPKYEIIICGKYKEIKEKDINYIFFKKFDTGWITGQKNKILEEAKYENVVVMHDRIVPSKDFYNGMKKYGNFFEVLSCKILNDEGKRCGDWITHGSKFKKAPRLGLLDYEDWDENGWIDGGLYILKKSVWKKAQWDEALFWNQGEDLKLMQDWKKRGIIQRFNNFSSCKTLSWRHGEFPLYEFNERKLGKRHYPKIKEWYDISIHNGKKLIKLILNKS